MATATVVTSGGLEIHYETEPAKKNGGPEPNGLKKTEQFRECIRPFTTQTHNCVDQLKDKVNASTNHCAEPCVEKVTDVSHETIDRGEECSVSGYEWLTSWLQ